MYIFHESRVNFIPNYIIFKYMSVLVTFRTWLQALSNMKVFRLHFLSFIHFCFTVIFFRFLQFSIQHVLLSIFSYLSRLMGKPTICICETKVADQLRGNRETDQRLCFRYSDSTIPPLLNSKISSF